MPPKVRITKENVLSEAIELVRCEGEGALNARSLASRLGCSTQPVFSNYPTMFELKADILSKALEIYKDYITREISEGKYPIYKSSGMAYVRFAKEEKELFKILLMRDRSKTEQNEDDPISIRFLQEKLGITKDVASIFHLEMWTFVHGIAVMSATSYLDLEEDIISEMLTDAFLGLKDRHLHKNTEESLK